MLSYTKPTPAQYAVYAQLHREAVAGAKRLRQLGAFQGRSP